MNIAVTTTIRVGLFIVRFPGLDTWHLAYPSVNCPDELTILPYAYSTRGDAMAALVDTRARRHALEAGR